MDYQLLWKYNKRLYFDGVARGNIPFSDLSTNLSDGVLQWGNNASSPMIEGFMGGPFPPDGSSFPKPSDNSMSNIGLGESGAYPKPWRSAAQRNNQLVYTNAGPYAVLKGFVHGSGDNEIDYTPEYSYGYSNNDGYEAWSTCTDDQLALQGPTGDMQPKTSLSGDTDNDIPGVMPGGGIPGRIGVNLSGDGDWRFFFQNWLQDEGTYDADFWNNNLNISSEAHWTDRKRWWAGTLTATIIAPIKGISDYSYQDGPKGEIEVAYAFPDFTDSEFYPGPNLIPLATASVTVLSAMVAVAAVQRWVL